MYGEKDDYYNDASYHNSGSGDLTKLRKWNSRNCALALFTVNQDVVVDELKQRFNLEANASWDLVKDLCLPVWIKDPYKLRQVTEWVAKVAYKIAGD